MVGKLKFYDMRAKKAFTTDKYASVRKSGKNWVVAKTPSGSKAYRIVGKK
jgi:hypothetical protein